MTSNIHYNLSAWAAGLYGTGNRVTNGGNVYQCTTSGLSSAAPTGKGTVINNGGAAVWSFVSTYDFPSLITWATALPATLTQPYVALLWNNGSITTTAGVQYLALAGVTTSPSNNITIMPAPGEGFPSAILPTPGFLQTGYVDVTANGTTIALDVNVPNPYSQDYPYYGNTAMTFPSYWEMTITSPTSMTGFSAGLGPFNGDPSNAGNSVLLQWHENGSLWADGGYQNVGGPGTWGAYSSGALLCMAYDPANGVVYGRVGTTGYWNNDPSANPATNTGGLPVPASILAASGVVPGGTLYQNNNTVVANWTTSSFAGTPPSGFGQIQPQYNPPALAFNPNAGVNFLLPATGAGGINYVNINVPNVVWSGIQMQDPNPSSGSTIFNIEQGGTVQGCIFDGASQNGGANLIGAASSSAVAATAAFVNNLIIDRALSGVSSITINTNYNNVFANNTVIALNAPASLIGLINQGNSAYSTSTTNNIFIGYLPGTTIGANNGASSSAQYSLFGSTTLTGGVTLGSGNLYSKTAANQFVSPTLNFRLKATAAAANAGLADTADIPSAVDILGQTRPQGTAWCIGAIEFPASSGAGSSSITFAASSVGLASVRAAGSSSITFTVAGTSASMASRGTSSITFSATAVSAGSSVAVGTSSITFAAEAYNSAQSVNASIQIDPIPPQQLNTPFNVTGTYSLVPLLGYVDDSGTTFTPLPAADVSSLGSIPFSFIHPGVGTTGAHSLVVTDTTSGDVGTATFVVLAAPTVFQSAFPPPGPTTIGQIIPSYLYQEYSDDDNLQALVAAYNGLAQGYLDWFNGINLPVYTGAQISGPLLDWVAAGLYGVIRPTLSYTTGLPAIGPFNTYPLNTIAFNTGDRNSSTTVYSVSDDLFKRIITWSFYKGDGFTFNVPWLKRRVMRFLSGVNGVDPGIDQTYQIGVSFTGASVINITVSNGSAPTTYAPLLRAAIVGGVLPLPFQYSYNVLIP